MKLKLSLILCALVAISVSSIQAAAKVAVIYGYHLKPPFITDLKKESGLYFDFSTYMNSKQKEYKFVTKYLPKKRVHKYIEGDRLNGALIGVNPVWYRDVKEEKYLWTPKIFTDRDEIISLTSTPFEFKGPKSLRGKKIGGVSGFYYWSLTKLKKGDFNRINVSSEKSILEMIRKKRVDTGIVSQSTFNYLVKENRSLKGKFHLSKNPHEEFERRILVPHSKKELYNFMKPLMAKMANDPAWKKYLNQYK